MKIKFLIVIWIVIISSISFAGIGDWTTFTNQGDIRDIILIDGVIWCATNGGVFSYEVSTATYRQFNNTNGLTSLDARAIGRDEQGRIWVGFADGWLNYFNPESDSWEYFGDLKGRAIYDIEAVGDSLLLIASAVGIHLYEIKFDHIKENYYHLGWALPEDIPVYHVVVTNDEIWAATGSGIGRAKFQPNSINLKAPDSWTNYTTAHGLPSKHVNTLVVHGDSIFAGTENGAAVLNENFWSTINNGLPNTNVSALVSKNGVLYALTKNNVTKWDATTNSWSGVGPGLYSLNGLVVSDNNEIWVGRARTTSSAGFALLSADEQQWQEFTPPGPPGNEISCLAIDKDGILWCGSLNDGVFRYDGETWKQYTTKDGLIRNRISVIAIDSQNRKWFGTTGGGVAIIDENDNISTIYTDHLSGIQNDPNFVVITDIKIDRYNNVWMLNLAAANNKVVAVYSVQQQWQYFSVQEGIFSDAVRALDFDMYDRAWVGSDGGVNVIDYNNTLMDKSDDDLSGTLTTIDGLEANHVKDIAIDQDNITWIATEGGLNYWAQGTVAYQYGLLSNSVNTIEVDVRNNKWFGTSAGVSVLAPDGSTWTHYTTDNSPLVSDNVTSFGFDNETGKVYIGTTNGLSCLETPYSKPLEDLSQVKAGPNPFMSAQDQVFAFYNLADDMAINIMTENGMIVRHIAKDEIFGSQAQWDGKNDAGDYVSSGVYLYVIYNDETGMNQVGKIAVIR